MYWMKLILHLVPFICSSILISRWGVQCYWKDQIKWSINGRILHSLSPGNCPSFDIWKYLEIRRSRSLLSMEENQGWDKIGSVEKYSSTEGSFTKPIAMTIPIYAISSSTQTLTHFILDGFLFSISAAYRFVLSTQVCTSARGINKLNISMIVVACKVCLDGPGVSTYGSEDPVLSSIPVNFFHGSSPQTVLSDMCTGFRLFRFPFRWFPSTCFFLLLQLDPGSSSAVVNSGES